MNGRPTRIVGEVAGAVVRTAAVIIVFAAVPALAESVTLDTPVPVGVRLADEDRTYLKGQVTAYDELGFDLNTADGPVRVEWDQLNATWVLNVHRRLLRDGTAEQWLAVGKWLWSAL